MQQYDDFETTFYEVISSPKPAIDNIYKIVLWERRRNGNTSAPISKKLWNALLGSKWKKDFIKQNQKKHGEKTEERLAKRRDKIITAKGSGSFGSQMYFLKS